MKISSLFTLLFLVLSLLGCSATIPKKEVLCSPDDKECNKIVNYCLLSQDKDQCTKQLLYQLSIERSVPECALDNQECIHAKLHCETAFHYDTCLIEIGKCAIGSPSNFDACAQEVLCFEGSEGCSVVNSAPPSPVTSQHPLTDED